MKKKILIFIYFVMMIDVFLLVYYFNIKTLPQINNIKTNNNGLLEVSFSYPKYKVNTETYCASTYENTTEYNSLKWSKSNGSKCIFDINSNPYYLYLKNNKNRVLNIEITPVVNKVIGLNIIKEKEYLAIDDTLTIKYDLDYTGSVINTIEWSSSNNSVATVLDGVVTPISSGEAIIILKIGNFTDSIEIIVTDTITKMPEMYDFNKKYLKCNQYTSKEAELLDKILKFRVEEAGYQTRAGAVAAGRFLSLEFPYRIRYFGENGRMDTTRKYRVDGEGRYYHEGLYLSEDKYAEIEKKAYGPKMWGCLLGANYLGSGKAQNGLDCSGFVTWALRNGGFDPGDIGAGVTSARDLTDIGIKQVLNSETYEKIKVGDLLSGDSRFGGHIGLVIGIDQDKNVYVAESITGEGSRGVFVSKHNITNITKNWYTVILMDSFYQKDGNISNMWY